MTGPAVEADGLKVRRRRRELLGECSFRIPRGAVCGLVGPNGAGKSLLLSLAAGLVRPTEGRLTVLGEVPGSERVMADVAYVGQSRSLYPSRTVAQLLSYGRAMNPRWDAGRAHAVLELGAVPLDARVGTLSGGGRTLVALALARARKARLLLLDEPMADLDPLARRRMTGLLLADVATDATTVVLSSHVLAELEDAVDHLVLLDRGRVRLAGEVPELLSAHRLLDAPTEEPDRWPGLVVEQFARGRHRQALVRLPAGRTGLADGTETDVDTDADACADEPSVEELVLSYLRSPQADGWLAPGMRPQAGAAADTVVTA